MKYLLLILTTLFFMPSTAKTITDGELSRRDTKKIQPFLGDYIGSFNEALTPDPNDDLNLNPCNKDLEDCSVHYAPLTGIVVRLTKQEDNKIMLKTYWSPEKANEDDPIDILGFGCHSQIGNLVEADFNSPNMEPSHNGLVQFAELKFELFFGRCTMRVHGQSQSLITVKIFHHPNSNEHEIKLEVDKDIRDANYLYTKIKGKKRKVHIKMDQLSKDGRITGYVVCLDDLEGTFKTNKCTQIKREIKTIPLAFPVPGGIAGGATWWTSLSPKVRRTKGLFEVIKYEGYFQPVRGDQ